MASLQSGTGDLSTTQIISQHRGRGPEFKKRPVFATCPECEKSIMTVVEKEESGCCCTCIICCSCFFSVLCVICAICAIFSDNDDSSPDCYDDSPSDCCVDSLPTTYIHKCSSCDKEIARFTY